jgi:hypothetical protein
LVCISYEFEEDGWMLNEEVIKFIGSHTEADGREVLHHEGDGELEITDMSYVDSREAFSPNGFLLHPYLMVYINGNFGCSIGYPVHLYLFFVLAFSYFHCTSITLR